MMTSVRSLVVAGALFGAIMLETGFVIFDRGRLSTSRNVSSRVDRRKTRSRSKRHILHDGS
jgi:hypothetical protein